MVDSEPLSSNSSAIQLTDVTVHLGNKDVLRSINLTIESGGIFALLGPSGCGKTTLMRILVGRLHPTSNHDGTVGTISIYDKYSHAFGRLVGYMPQETALHTTNTIEEELFFYGRLANMPTEKLQQRCQFLIHLLELPNKSKLIRKLSGGQQRRVSFALALIHEPNLLILDEPTVGVDPLLRRKIWQHLIEITMNGNRTAIVTTHYIEEARQANIVSFMRHGQLLETDRPDKLLIKHNQQTLEGVFLELCEERHLLNIQNRSRDKVHLKNPLNIMNKICQPFISSSSKSRRCCDAIRSCARPSFGRSFYALLIKDLLKFQRNPAMLVIHFLVPILQITLFCLCVGRKLTNISVGFVSREIIQSSTTSGLIMEKIDKNVINLIGYKSLSDAQRMFEKGHLSGVIDIGANFTREVLAKVEHCSFADENEYSDAQVLIYVDQTNRQMMYAIAEEIIRALKNTSMDFKLGFWSSPDSKHALLRLGRSTNDQLDFEFTFTHFMVPGIVLSVIFFMNVGLTALSLVLEQSDGTQDRVWITGHYLIFFGHQLEFSSVLGVRSDEIVLSQLIIHLMILIIQIVIVLFTALVIFELPLKGSLICTILLCAIQGLCGMTFGLIISTIFTTEINTHQVTMAAFYPVLLLSGIIWPLEGQPMWLRTITTWLPMTKAIEAMRGVLLKGWDIKHLVVQQAFVVTSVWTICFLILTLLIFNYRRL
ncbi:unnamed protein product [Adineta ricciae]|uniref:ABC transporter domain-containing protein n=1 Tax=Adineta ricciae TaxID=249248 RepID=A0A814N4F0_ADIRI|nr:unnamed protein product [Adineta ricciae]